MITRIQKPHLTQYGAYVNIIDVSSLTFDNNLWWDLIRFSVVKPSKFTKEGGTYG